jgi:hypothetical protein
VGYEGRSWREGTLVGVQGRAVLNLGLCYVSVTCSLSVRNHGSKRNLRIRWKQTSRFRGEITLQYYKMMKGRSQWPRGLRRGSVAARLLGLQVWIPPGAWMSVCWVLCVLTGRGLCDGPTECGVSECDVKTSTMHRPWPTRAVEPWKNMMKAWLSKYRTYCVCVYVYFVHTKPGTRLAYRSYLPTRLQSLKRRCLEQQWVHCIVDDGRLL